MVADLVLSAQTSTTHRPWDSNQLVPPFLGQCSLDRYTLNPLQDEYSSTCSEERWSSASHAAVVL